MGDHLIRVFIAGKKRKNANVIHLDEQFHAIVDPDGNQSNQESCRYKSSLRDERNQLISTWRVVIGSARIPTPIQVLIRFPVVYTLFRTLVNQYLRKSSGHSLTERIVEHKRTLLTEIQQTKK